MRALIVGAGAVGQVFGHHLALAGVEVTFFVKPKYVDECRRGFTMYPLNKKGAPAERFEGAGVMTTAAEVAAVTWDVVFLAISSTALRVGTWLEDIGKATGKASIVFLPPNLKDREFLISLVDPARIVDGMIGFIAYHAPLEGETRFATPGMAYFFPPGSPSPFSGDPVRRDAIVDVLRRGKLPAVKKPDLRKTSAFPNAILLAYLCALEGADWSFAKVRRGDYLRIGGRGAAQAMRVAGSQIGTRVPLALRLAARPFVMRIVLRLAPRMIPIPMEIYLKTHFTKVGDQTRQGMRSFIEIGKKAGFDVSAIEQLTNFLAAG